MKYRLATVERVNVGNYEYVEINGGVEFDTDDIPPGVTPAKFARDELDTLLNPHRRRALAFVPTDEASFITEHPALERP
ncbi:hypothetical protein [Streptomyces sp. NPDC017448]|uniref:hypothetical protein n=1 Tax=Streptomyces sp. NPDC017448 TaxID=3364996 RepID=UPI0037899B99